MIGPFFRLRQVLTREVSTVPDSRNCKKNGSLAIDAGFSSLGVSRAGARGYLWRQSLRYPERTAAPPSPSGVRSRRLLFCIERIQGARRLFLQLSATRLRQERGNSRGSATVGLRSRNASCLLGIIFDEQKRCLWLLEFRQRLQHFVAQISNVLTCIY